MKIRISLAVLVLLGVCSVVSVRDTTAFAKSASFEGGGLPTPCPPPGVGTVCVLQNQK